MSQIKSITPPLAAHFVWHPNDYEKIFPLIDKFRQYLTRDIDRPFSRELNIPTFLYSSRQPDQPPTNKPKELSSENVVFLFLSTNTLIDENWKIYIDSLTVTKKMHLIPVAVDKNSLNHASSGCLKNLNFIRSFDWPEPVKKEYGILTLSHELYRFGLKKIYSEKAGKDSSIKLFISHAKKGDTGLKHAESIKNFLDNSNMQRFFDANEISPAFRFDEEIEKHIHESTIIAIASDAYSSRYWCQREILCAKKERRPIIVVNSLENYEDRIFPAAANVPCVHVTAEPLQEKDILYILIAALLETIRFEYAKKLLIYYKGQCWINSSAEPFSRPPEIQQLVDLLEIKKKSNLEQLHVCYPEPPLYREETDWTDHFGIKISTPLWSTEEKDLSRLRVGISISDYEEDGYKSWHLHLDELKRFSQSLARHLLARENTLIYGGDLRDDGFTQFILEEATVLRDRLQVEKLYVENHLAWPLYTKEESTTWAGKYYGVLKIKQHNIPDDVAQEIKDENHFLPPNCPENKYIWSRCLTEMRQQSINSSDARVFAGGKLKGYLGKMPGVLEEFLLACEENKPIYLIGGLGGLSHEICQSILNEKMSNLLKEKWQLLNNEGYSELQEIAKKLGFHADYIAIEKIIESLTIEMLSKQAGLSVDDYKRLMISHFVDECVHLVLKGLRKIAGEKTNV